MAICPCNSEEKKTDFASELQFLVTKVLFQKVLLSTKKKKGKYPSSAGRMQKKQWCFSDLAPSGYHRPIASYGTIFAAKWSSNGGIEAVVSE